MSIAIDPRKNPVYYTYTQSFRGGDIIASFPENTFDVVIGLDIGHSRTRAFQITRSPDDIFEGVLSPVLLYGQESIPTAIRYGDDLFIGSEAVAEPGFFQNFIKTPDRWEDPVDGEHTYGELLDDYVYVLTSHIRESDGDIDDAWLTGRLLWVVSCPPGKAWLSHMDTLCARLQDAAVTQAVSVVPAPLADLIFLLQEDRYLPYQGAAVYNLGAASVDFSYICAGKTLLARSLPLGGTQLDYVLLDRAMDASGLHEDDIPYELRASILQQIGEAKAHPDVPLNIPLPGGKALSWPMSASGLELLLTAPGSGLHGQSFAQSLSHFFRDTALLLRDRPLRKVYLTGGLSRLPTVTMLALQYFRPDQVITASDPDTATARGLALYHGQTGWSIRSNYERFDRYLKVYEEDQRTLLTGPYGFFPVAPELSPFDLVFRKTFLPALAEYYDGVFYQLLREAFLSVQDRSSSTREVVKLLKASLTADPRMVGKPAEEGLMTALRRSLRDAAYYVFEALEYLKDDLHGYTLNDLYVCLNLPMPDLDRHRPMLSAVAASKALILDVMEPAKHVHQLVESVTSWGGVTDRLGDLSGEAFSAMHRLFDFTLTPERTAAILKKLPETPEKGPFDHSAFFISGSRFVTAYDKWEGLCSVLKKLHDDAMEQLLEISLGKMTLRLFAEPADLY